VGCSSSDEPTNPNGNLIHGTLTASVDGAAFSGTQRVTAALSSGGALAIYAIGTTATGTKAIQIDLGGVQAAGTINLNPAPAGASASYSESNTSSGITLSWLVTSVQGSGTVVITHLTSTHIMGTFSFSAPPGISAGAVGTKVVTAGAFSIALTNPE
jgi:hypothetical protein